jgi:hypothetical protein
MQSSTAIAIRALIMLIVLISVPLFAMFGKNLPEVFKGVLEGRGLVLGPAPVVGANTPGTVPLPAANNLSGQSGPYRASPDSNFRTSPVVAPQLVPLGGNLSASGISGGGMGVGGISSVPAVGTNATPVLKSSGGTNSGASALTSVASSASTADDWKSPPTGPPGMAQPAGFQAPVGSMPLTPPVGVSPVDNAPASARPQTGPYPTSISSDANAISSNGSPISPAPIAAGGDEKFRQAETRLRELGATHYVLETWGPDNNRYRFACKMAIGGNGGVNRYFQAIEDDPWRAMTAVLHQVEEWRNQPQPQ